MKVIIVGLAIVAIAFPVLAASPPYAYVTNAFTNNVSVVDWTSNTVVATIPVGLDPEGLAATPDGTFVYVANVNSSSVSVIATSNNAVVATIPVFQSPREIAITPDGKFAYVTGEDALEVIAIAFNEVIATIALPRAFGVAVTPNGQFVYVTNGSNVTVVATATNQVIATIAVDLGPTSVAITPDGKFAYVPCNAGTVSVIDTATNALLLTDIQVVYEPNSIAITPDGAFAYVTNGFGGISVVATATNTVFADIPLKQSGVGVAVSPNGDFAYVANQNYDTITVVSTSTQAIVANIAVGGSPGAVAFLPNAQVPAAPKVVSFKVLFGTQTYNLAGSTRDRLPWRIGGIQAVFSQPITSGDAASLSGAPVTGFNGLGTNTLTWTINPVADANLIIVLAGSGAHALQNAGGSALGQGAGYRRSLKVLCGDYNDDGVVNASDLAGINKARSHPYDIFADTNGNGTAGEVADLRLAGTFAGTTNASGIGFPPYAYVANYGSNNVSVIDTTLNAVVATIPAGAYPTFVTVSPDDQQAYVLSQGSSFISTISTATNSVTAATPGVAIHGVAVSPDGQFLYTTNSETDSLIVTSRATNQVVATIPISPGRGISYGATSGLIAISPDNRFVYVSSIPYSNETSGAVSIVSTATQTQIAEVSTDSGATGAIAFSPDSKFAYVPVSYIAFYQFAPYAYAENGTLVVISTDTNQAVASIPVGYLPMAAAVTPDGKFVYVANAGYFTQYVGSVSVISTESNQVVATVPVDGASGVAITADGAYAYVTDSLTNTVAVLSTATNSVIATIPVGSEPGSIALVPGPVVQP